VHVGPPTMCKFWWHVTRRLFDWLMLQINVSIKNNNVIAWY